MEIITGVERRRRWRLVEKLRIVAEVEQLGASFADVARRHEISRGLLWHWRRRIRRVGGRTDADISAGADHSKCCDCSAVSSPGSCCG